MIIIGIDPGKNGGIAFINTVTEEYNVYVYSDMTLRTLCDLLIYQNCDVQCFVENVHAMPKQGVVSTFNFGKSFGYILGVLEAHDFIVSLVSPQTWKNFFGVTSDKNTSIEKCVELFPQVNLLATNRSRKPHDGMAEALLIAEYGRAMNV